MDHRFLLLLLCESGALALRGAMARPPPLSESTSMSATGSAVVVLVDTISVMFANLLCAVDAFSGTLS